jgi:hypothetical protein
MSNSLAIAAQKDIRTQIASSKIVLGLECKDQVPASVGQMLALDLQRNQQEPAASATYTYLLNANATSLFCNGLDVSR